MRAYIMLLLAAMWGMTPMPSSALNRAAALQAFASENAECTAYFVVIGMALEKRGLDAERQSLRTYQEMSHVLGIRTEGLIGKEAADAAIYAALRGMKSYVDGTPDSFSRLVKKYAEPCQEVLLHPEQREREWQHR